MAWAVIVALRANVEPDFSTLRLPEPATGFSYILNGSRLNCGRLARPKQT